MSFLHFQKPTTLHNNLQEKNCHVYVPLHLSNGLQYVQLPSCKYFPLEEAFVLTAVVASCASDLTS